MLQLQRLCALREQARAGMFEIRLLVEARRERVRQARAALADARRPAHSGLNPPPANEKAGTEPASS